MSGKKDNCSRHKKDIAGISDMAVLSEMIGDLHYETLAELLGRIGIKLYKDGLKDRMNEREKLGYALTDASDEIKKAAEHIKEAWEISKPFMKTEN